MTGKLQRFSIVVLKDKIVASKPSIKHCRFHPIGGVRIEVAFGRSAAVTRSHPYLRIWMREYRDLWVTIARLLSLKIWPTRYDKVAGSSN